jgi:hypothetical protein
LALEDQAPNINVIRSVWRRIRKGKIRDLEIRDLEPLKDVKGGRLYKAMFSGEIAACY